MESVYEHPDILGAGARLRRKFVRSKKSEMQAVMHEFKKGTLRSGSGRHVTNHAQAVMIGLSEGRRRGLK